MRSQDSGINQSMSLITFDDEAAFDWVVDQVECQRRTKCDTRPAARAAAARDIGIAPGTVANIDRNRRKSLQSWVRDKIRTHKINWLRAEWQGLHMNFRSLSPVHLLLLKMTFRRLVLFSKRRRDISVEKPHDSQHEKTDRRLPCLGRLLDPKGD